MEKVTKDVYFHQQYIVKQLADMFCPRRPALFRQQVENIHFFYFLNRILLLVFVRFVVLCLYWPVAAVGGTGSVKKNTVKCGAGNSSVGRASDWKTEAQY